MKNIYSIIVKKIIPIKRNNRDTVFRLKNEQL